MSATTKPLSSRAYGSTPHLPGSRLGPGDWSIHVGQARICTDQARDRHDVVIVTEKLDGSCCAVANIDGAIVPLTRAGYQANTSPFFQHHRFAEWVATRQALFEQLIAPGFRLAGEWMLQAHGSRYCISNPDALFVPFALIQGKQRAPYTKMVATAAAAGLMPAALISWGAPCSIAAAMETLGLNGRHGCQGPAEGAVWIVERSGVFDFAAKWVRPDKRDGALLPEISGGDPVWNWQGPMAQPALHE